MAKQTKQSFLLHFLSQALTRLRTGYPMQQIKPSFPQSQYPTTNNPDAWKAHWKAQGQPWRIEPEISEDRQAYLSERRAIISDIKEGTAPFKGITLNRADIEWLLATLENGLGPVDWSNESQRTRNGLDLGGANMRNVHLRDLPLARMSGFSGARVIDMTTRQIETVAIDLEGANLAFAHLENAMFMKANLSKVHAYGVHLKGAYLSGASCENACLDFSHLEKTVFTLAHLEKASLKGTHLEGANIAKANLAGAVLCNVFFDSATQLDDVILSSKQYGSVSLADVRWGDVNLAVVDWSQIDVLGDEQVAKQKRHEGEVKDTATRLKEYESAVRANRQLAAVLRAQGLNEKADHFAYRAQRLQRVVLRRQAFLPKTRWWQKVQKLCSYVFSLLLDLIAGYGYHPGKTLLWYLLVTFGFSGAYAVWGHMPLFPDACVFSLTSFHGRGFFPGLRNNVSLHDPLIELAALEAVIGLLIEVSVIATFTQRYFGK